MKKFILLFLGLFLMANISSAQVDDRAVIPVAVTLNSILRLNVVSGGNIEFNFNTLNDYTDGIQTSTAHQTVITVASSVNWDLDMYPEDGALIGTDLADGTDALDIENIGFQLMYSGIGGVADDYTFISTIQSVKPGVTTIISKGATATTIAGDIARNRFTFHWRCATGEGDILGSILAQNVKAGRYATNIFLILKEDI
jgi:hypothetical protein